MHTIQNLGIKYETTENVDSATENYYKIGLFNRSWGSFPRVSFGVYQQWFNSFNPDILHISKANIISQLSNLPINGMGLYLSLSRDGEGVTITNGVKTIVPPSVTTQSFTTHFEASDSDESGFFKSVTGNRMMSYSESIDLSQPGNFLTSVWSYQGQNIADSVIIEETAPLNPGTIELPYVNGNSLEVIFNSVNISKYMLNYTHTIDSFNRAVHLKGDRFPSFIKNGNRVYSVGFTVVRNSTTDAIYTALLNQTVDSTYPSMSFKIYQDSTHYRKHEFSSVLLLEAKMNHAMINREELPTYEISALVLPSQYVIYDDLANSFYGVS